MSWLPRKVSSEARLMRHVARMRLILGQKIVGLHLPTKARELASFRNFVPTTFTCYYWVNTEISWNATMVRQSPNAPARAAAMNSLEQWNSARYACFVRVLPWGLSPGSLRLGIHSSRHRTSQRSDLTLRVGDGRRRKAS